MLSELYLTHSAKFTSREANKDDLLDALVLLLSNKKCAEAGYSFLSDENKFDQFGIPMKIAYYDCLSG